MSDIRVVFDCMILLQALARPQGPAGKCVEAAEVGRVEMLLSNAALYEIESVVSRIEIRSTLILKTDGEVAEFLTRLLGMSKQVYDVPHRFHLPRDPKDEKYMNLAIAADAAFVVSRDSHLLDLMTATDAPATLFRAAFPTIEILRPEPFLARLPQVP